MPGLVVNGTAVGIDAQVLGLDEMTGKMKITDALRRHRGQEFVCVVSMVDAVDDDVVDVQHQVTVRLLEHGEQELAFVHRRVDGGVVRNVFERDALLEDVLYASHPSRNMPDRVFGKRNRHQVIQLPVVPGSAQVFRVHANAVFGHEGLDVPNEGFIEWRRRADRQ